MAALLDDGSISLTGEEHGLLLNALALAKSLCLDMEADSHRDDEGLAEVRLLNLVERLEMICVAPLPPRRTPGPVDDEPG